MNHAPTDSDVTLTNVNAYNQLSSQERNGIVVPAYFKPGASSNAIKISVNFTINFKDFTMCAWAYKTINANHSNIFTIGNASARFSEFRFQEGTANQGTIQAIAFPFEPNTWKFMVATMKDNLFCRYIDGVLIDTQTFTNNNSTYSIFQILGTTCWSSDTGNSGYATDCRIYNHALTSEDILEMYNRGPQWHK